MIRWLDYKLNVFTAWLVQCFNSLTGGLIVVDLTCKYCAHEIELSNLADHIKWHKDNKHKRMK